MIITTGLYLWHIHNRQQSIPFVWLLVSACGLRLLSLTGTPLFEDDYFRYLWDGFQTFTNRDPYSLAPSVFFDRDVPEIFEPILSLINYPDIATVYGPVNQWLFALAYVISPAEVWPLQLLCGLADVAILIMLHRIGAGRALLFYAWSPLILKETALTAHPDVFAIAAMMATLWAASTGRVFQAGLWLAIAVGSKVFAILVLPFLLPAVFPLKAWFSYWLRIMGGFILGLAALSASFGSVMIWVPEGLQAMADSWLFNAPLFYLLLPWLGFTQIKLLLLAIFALMIAAALAYRWGRAWRQGLTPEQWVQGGSPPLFRGDLLFGVFLLCIPVLNPWYALWVLPFAARYPSSWAWTASAVILLSYWQSLKPPTQTEAHFNSAELNVLIQVGIIVLVFIVGACVNVWLRQRQSRS